MASEINSKKIAKLRVILDTEQDVYRDIEISTDSTLLHFHNAILDSFGWASGEMASFFESDESWDKGKEYSLMDIGGDGDMTIVKVEAIIKDTGSRAVYVYDFLRMWCFYIEPTSNVWPHYLLNLNPGDVIVILDVRRYENNTLKLAKMATEKGAEIILFTDQWISPIGQLTDNIFSARIIVPSAWDSSVSSLLLIEAMIAQVQELIWPSAKQRIEELESMFDDTRLFRKFV